MKRHLRWQEWKEPLVGEEDGDDMSEDIYGVKVKNIPHLVCKSNYGFISLKIHGPLTPDFKFWIAHCNFDITTKEKNIIEDTEGIEILDFFSSYRFRLAVGLNFNEERVKRSIYRRLCGPKSNFQLSSEIKKSLIDLRSSGEYWLLYALNENKFEYYSSINEDDFRNTYLKYEKAYLDLGGRLISGSGV